MLITSCGMDSSNVSARKIKLVNQSELSSTNQCVPFTSAFIIHMYLYWLVFTCKISIHALACGIYIYKLKCKV